KQYKPFATIQQAINAIEAIGGTDTYLIKVGAGVGGSLAFNSGSQTIWVDAVTPIGDVTVSGGTIHVSSWAGGGNMGGTSGTLYVHGLAGNIVTTGTTVVITGRVQ